VLSLIVVWGDIDDLLVEETVGKLRGIGSWVKGDVRMKIARRKEKRIERNISPGLYIYIIYSIY